MSETKPCPYCAEDIKAAAVVCKHCGRDIGPDTRAVDEPPCRQCGGAIEVGSYTPSRGTKGIGWFALILGAVLLIFAPPVGALVIIAGAICIAVDEGSPGVWLKCSKCGTGRAPWTGR
jgi:predicted phage tail protein